MNEITADTAVTEVTVAEAPVYIFNDLTGRFEDKDGNASPVEETFTTDEGVVASPADVTVH